MKTFFEGPFKNSLFSTPEWKNKSAMIIIPHQDDEINLSGATILNLLSHHIRTFVIFCTNSDRFEPGILRIQEGIRSCKALGIPDEDIIFLGYCNTFRIHYNLHFYNAEDDTIVVTSTRNLTKTYGRPEKPEFYFLHHQIHHAYTKQNLRNDIKEVILMYQPDIIFANDFDRHPDHRAFSFIIEEALSEILHRPQNIYHPEIYKGFCYNGSYLGKRDFYSTLNLQGATPAENGFSNDPSFDTDYPPYNWKERLRLPVPKGYISRTLNGSALYPAIRAHFSQGLLHNAKRIINSDQIFWRRRTDSLVYQSNITVSSGNGTALADFKLADCPDVLAMPAELTSGTWIPEKEDPHKTALIKFSSPQRISRIILYGNVVSDSQVLSGQLQLSNGYCQNFGPLLPGAKATICDITPSQKEILWIRVKLIKTQGDRAGINEIEAYTTKNAPTLIHFIKIMIDKSFSYDYWLTDSKKEIRLQLYECTSSGINTYNSTIPPEYAWKAENQDDFTLRNNTILFGPHFKEAVIRVNRTDMPELYDQIIIHKKNLFQIGILKLFQGLDAAYNRIEHVVKHRYYKKYIKEKNPDVGKIRK